MDSLMAWLHAKLAWLPKLGGGYSWRVNVGGKEIVVMLWPFVAFAIFLAAILLLDAVIR